MVLQGAGDDECAPEHDIAGGAHLVQRLERCRQSGTAAELRQLHRIRQLHQWLQMHQKHRCLQKRQCLQKIQLHQKTEAILGRWQTLG